MTNREVPWVTRGTEGSSDASREPFDKEKLRKYIDSVLAGLDTTHLAIEAVLDKVYTGLPSEVCVDELIDFTADVCASLTTKHYQYSNLAARILEKRLQDSLPSSFSQNLSILRNYNARPRTPKTGFHHLVSQSLYEVALANSKRLDSAIVASRDYDIDYFGFKTLERSYLLKVDGKPHETPQFLLMRVALGIHGDDIDAALETYELMSQKYFLHASPTLFNAGTEFAHLSSCFLLGIDDDSLDSIFHTVHQCAMISKAAGGIGMHISNIRSAGSYISGTNGCSSGIVPMLRVFNSTAKYVDQGGNRRPGAICAYLEPWHGDVMDFLDMRKNHGKEEYRARDLFYALWIPDLFMRRVEADAKWSLFSEDTAPHLSDVYGAEFDTLYEKYEAEGRQLKTLPARKVWERILYAQIETGTPFLLYKDACNMKSNQKNLGTIKSSNLCCEVVEYSSKDEIAVCNLCSLGLPTFVKSDGSFDYAKLHDVTKIVVRNLNKIIDVGAYPLPECKTSNLRHRPIAVGVQGLADVFYRLHLPFGSVESRVINARIFETIYHAALECSVELSKELGPYETFEGSPASKGELQFDLWNVTPSKRYDWGQLKEKIQAHGLRNSLLTALMPTASTSQILGYTECFEPLTSNLYTRRVLSGEHQVVNSYLVDDLVSRDLWTPEMKDAIVAANGSIQRIDSIPADVKAVYKTVWEISQKEIIDMAADRAPYVDQSQSMNLFMLDCSMAKLTSMHFYAWKKGLKTGMYYLRTQAAAAAIKFTLTPDVEKRGRKRKAPGTEESTPDDDGDIIFSTTPIKCRALTPDQCDSCSA